MDVRRFLIALSIAIAGIAFAAPPAAADTCASAVLENTLCTPVNAAYCAMDAGKFVAACEAGVVQRCIDACPDDLPDGGSSAGATCTPYVNVLGSKQRTCVDAAQAPSCGAWTEGWSHPIGYWKSCYGTGAVCGAHGCIADDIAISGCIRNVCLA